MNYLFEVVANWSAYSGVNTIVNSEWFVQLIIVLACVTAAAFLIAVVVSQKWFNRIKGYFDNLALAIKIAIVGCVAYNAYARLKDFIDWLLLTPAKEGNFVNWIYLQESAWWWIRFLVLGYILYRAYLLLKVRWEASQTKQAKPAKGRVVVRATA
jgi:hypothetical protein